MSPTTTGSCAASALVRSRATIGFGQLDPGDGDAARRERHPDPTGPDGQLERRPSSASATRRSTVAATSASDPMSPRSSSYASAVASPHTSGCSTRVSLPAGPARSPGFPRAHSSRPTGFSGSVR